MASKITFRLFSKYGNPTYTKDQVQFEAFGVYFRNNFNLTLLESHLQLMFSRKTNFVGSKCLNFNIKVVSASLKIEETMAKLKPYIDNILYDMVIPIMMATHRDISLF